MRRRKPSSKPRTAPERLLAILPLLQYFWQLRAGCAITVVLSNGRKAGTSETIAADIALQCGVCLRSIWRWYDAFKQAGGCAGFAALMRRKRSDKGKRRYFDERPYVAQLLAKLIFRKKLSAKAAYDSISGHIAEPPCYQTVCRELKRVRAQARAARRRRKRTP
ncbi:MAG: hypothetical protein LAN64_20610 [Acidobacteriia bacterium]|nr:hypothetical protein [Terriglobia bacterium]